MPHQLLAALSELVPPLVVAIAFCVAIIWLVRAEMAPKRRIRRTERNDDE